MRRAALQMLQHQIVRPLDVRDHLQQCDDLTEVAGDRSLQREDAIAVLLEVERTGIDLVVALDDVVGTLEVAVEQHRGGSRDRLRHRRREPNQLGAGVVEIVVEALAQLVHQPNLPVTYCSVRVSSGVEKIFAVRPNSTITPVR